MSIMWMIKWWWLLLFFGLIFFLFLVYQFLVWSKCPKLPYQCVIIIGRIELRLLSRTMANVTEKSSSASISHISCGILGTSITTPNRYNELTLIWWAVTIQPEPEPEPDSIWSNNTMFVYFWREFRQMYRYYLLVGRHSKTNWRWNSIMAMNWQQTQFILSLAQSFNETTRSEYMDLCSSVWKGYGAHFVACRHNTLFHRQFVSCHTLNCLNTWYLCWTSLTVQFLFSSFNFYMYFEFKRFFFPQIFLSTQLHSSKKSKFSGTFAAIVFSLSFDWIKFSTIIVYCMRVVSFI